MPTFIIAEAGVNHNGSIDLAMRLIDAAADAGADAVKFQTFRAQQLVSAGAPKAAYQTLTTDAAESQLDMLRRLELGDSDHEGLMAHARERGIEFLSTPFDLPSLAMLTKELGLRRIKIPSGEITNAPLLLATARAAERVILSTGMSTLADVEAALGVLAFGFTQSGTPSHGATENAFASETGQRALRDKVVLLHCTTEYPAPFGEVNLRAMDTLSKVFGLPVGYSDHTIGIHIPVAAVARGACIIEKHFTLDRSLPGPDHTASLEPSELTAMVSAIRDVELALGDGIKSPSASEWKNRDIARKSLVVLSATAAGDTWTTENLGCKRPGTGISPMHYWQLLGQPADRAYQTDELLGPVKEVPGQ